ncbi:MAG TPA: SUMF1/EgtB/PvdO family nonheme iron enzyme [Myxococcota bacterium]|nr:SUMF1/EgtB/PvdO family nonheme iron enzyme [Myxococcota bacterium]HPB51604.1 SUMF1/EgtB/PvdO family nonheme iron enzyme [Myxococcota bacterium]HQP96536.1 SUMF1/EgtB/PvdO family nonheme iron enzyme [Myxococcota bacterium]
MTSGAGMDGQGSGKARLSPWLVIVAVLVGMAVCAAGIGGFWLVGRWIGNKHEGKAHAGASQQASTSAPVPVPDPAPAPVSDSKVRWVSVPGTGLEFSRTEVTVAEYERCVREGPCTSPHFNDGECKIYAGSSWYENGYRAGQEFQRADSPVVCVTYAQASQFAAWAGGRLPSGREWQAALASLPERSLSCESVVMKGGRGELGGCGSNSTRPVCSRGEYGGLCDMRGNVWEMVADTRFYKGISHQVNCGGSWTTYDPVKFGGCENLDLPYLGVNNLGFRIVR